MNTTSGVVSTICYARKESAVYKLQKLQERAVLRWWALIEHPEYIKAETGELRKKHLHLIVEAGESRLNLQALAEELTEIDLQDPTGQALGCMPFRRSIVQEWLAYSLHLSDYCHYHHLKKPYYDLPMSELITNDREYITAVYEQLPRDKWKSAIAKMQDALKAGKSPIEFCDEEHIPISQLGIVFKTWNTITEALFSMENRPK